MRVSLAGFQSSLPFFSGLIRCQSLSFSSSSFRQFEQEMETVINVLQPGPLGIIEHKFSAEEISEAKATVHRAVANWKRNASLEERNIGLKDYIQK